MSTNATATPAALKPTKSKKLLIIGAVVALVLVLAGAAAFWVLSQRQQHADGEGDEPASAAPAVAAVVPTFLPMDTMVVNLADPGGERFAQVGIALELADTKTADTLRQYLPSIRSNILLLISQRTSDELLLREGKEQLAADILREVSRPLGFEVPQTVKSSPRGGASEADAPEEDRPATRKQPANPVHRVHFSGFIIQ